MFASTREFGTEQLMLHHWSNAISICMLVTFVALTLIDLFKLKGF